MVDNRADENFIWNFQKTVFNADVIKNNYGQSLQSIFGKTDVPWWGKKLMVREFTNPESVRNFMIQTQIRGEFEDLKKKHAIERVDGDNLQHDR